VKKLRIYLDTSVISYLDAQDAPEKMADTFRLWEQILDGRYNVVLSDVVFDELNDCEQKKRSVLLACIGRINYDMAEENSDALAIARRFIDFGILTKKSLSDCRHIAAALVSGCDVITSWNFKHIVNDKTINGTKAIVAAEGYKDIIICTPAMLIREGFDND